MSVDFTVWVLLQDLEYLDASYNNIVTLEGMKVSILETSFCNGILLVAFKL